MLRPGERSLLRKPGDRGARLRRERQETNFLRRSVSFRADGREGHYGTTRVLGDTTPAPPSRTRRRWKKDDGERNPHSLAREGLPSTRARSRPRRFCAPDAVFLGTAFHTVSRFRLPASCPPPPRPPRAEDAGTRQSRRACGWGGWGLRDSKGAPPPRVADSRD